MGNCFYRNNNINILKVHKILTKYGKNGLYTSDGNIDQLNFLNFQTFCSKLQKRLNDSPRNKLLLRLTNKSNKIYDDNNDVKKMYSYFNLKRETYFLCLINRYNLLNTGKIYKRYLVYNEKSTYLPLSKTEVSNAIQNKKRKFDKIDHNYDDFDWHNFIDEINNIKKSRTLEFQDKATKLKEILKTDKNYLNYQKIKKVWELYGFNTMAEEFNKLDYSNGENKRLRGEKFESMYGNVSFNFIKNYIIKNTSMIEKNKFSFYYNCYWYNINNPVGEIDIVILYNNKVVAIGELKSNCFDIVNGYNQHKRKIDAKYKIRINNCDYNINDDVIIFLITLIQEYEYIVGTDSKLIKIIGDHLTDNGLDEGRKLIDNFTLADFKEFRDLARKKLDLTESPDVFLKKYHDKILILNPYNN